jgi:hypothetical protein
VGSWGGEHIALEVTTSGARIAYDCAYGSIHEPLRADEHGSFDVLGVHVREHGGPVREGEPLEERPARYTGWVTEGEMTLTVTLTDTGQQVGTFTLRRGEPPRVYRCL